MLGAVLIPSPPLVLQYFLPPQTGFAGSELNRRMVNRILNLFSGTPIYPPISYIGSMKFNRIIAANWDPSSVNLTDSWAME